MYQVPTLPVMSLEQAEEFRQLVNDLLSQPEKYEIILKQLQRNLTSIYKPEPKTLGELADKPNSFGVLFTTPDNSSYQFIMRQADGEIVATTGKTLRYFHSDTKIRIIF